MATRLALGAPSWQLARQLVVENVLLTAVAGALGLALGAAAVRFASSFDFRALPYGKDIRLDGMAALYALALALAIGSLLGAAAAAERAAARTRAACCGEEGRGRRAAVLRALRRTLVVGPGGLHLRPDAGCRLLLASFANVLGVDSGLRARARGTASVSLRARATPTRRRAARSSTRRCGACARSPA